MKFTKFLIGAAALCLAAVIIQPAQGAVGMTSFSISNILAAPSTTTSSTTNGNAVKIDAQDNCTLMFVGKSMDTGTSNITFTIARSMDNLLWENTPTFTFVAAINSTTTNVTITNLSSAVIGACSYLKVTQIHNPNATWTTNCALYLVQKTIKRAP